MQLFSKLKNLVTNVLSYVLSNSNNPFQRDYAKSIDQDLLVYTGGYGKLEMKKYNSAQKVEVYLDVENGQKIPIPK